MCFDAATLGAAQTLQGKAMRNGLMQRGNHLRAMAWIIALMAMTEFWALTVKLLLAVFGE
jgi:hypothetical protein